jgi:hypothetical protein
VAATDRHPQPPQAPPILTRYRLSGRRLPRVVHRPINDSQVQTRPDAFRDTLHGKQQSNDLGASLRFQAQAPARRVVCPARRS